MPDPLAGFHFRVDWGGTQLAFSEISGLNVAVRAIEYPDGLSRDIPVVKMPGLMKYGNLTLKRGIVAADNEFFDWVKEIKLDKPERRNIVITLLAEDHSPVVTWKILNACPTKITWPDLKAKGNEAAIESLEIAHEGIEVENG